MNETRSINIQDLKSPLQIATLLFIFEQKSTFTRLIITQRSRLYSN